LGREYPEGRRERIGDTSRNGYVFKPPRSLHEIDEELKGVTSHIMTMLEVFGRMSTKLAKKDSEFSEVLGIIRAGRAKAYEAVNVALIETYWAVGAHLSQKVAEASWGKWIVKELSDWLLIQAPDLKGFSASNLWRMKQFYEIYADQPKLAALLRVLPWTHNLIILGHSKRPEEREF
jgi:hypothetical protein